jgi:hypothetical protein
MDWAPRKHKEVDVEWLRDINVDVEIVGSDRNVIVHGIVHATIEHQLPKPPAYSRAGEAGEALPFVRAPCWTISRGAKAGRTQRER